MFRIFAFTSLLLAAAAPAQEANPVQDFLRIQDRKPFRTSWHLDELSPTGDVKFHAFTVHEDNSASIVHFEANILQLDEARPVGASLIDLAGLVDDDGGEAQIPHPHYITVYYDIYGQKHTVVTLRTHPGNPSKDMARHAAAVKESHKHFPPAKKVWSQPVGRGPQ